VSRDVSDISQARKSDKSPTEVSGTGSLVQLCILVPSYRKSVNDDDDDDDNNINIETYNRVILS
jgi:hypothetical protein